MEGARQREKDREKDRGKDGGSKRGLPLDIIVNQYSTYSLGRVQKLTFKI